MTWLTETFNSNSIAWLLTSSTVAILSGFASSWLTFNYIRRRELIEQSKLEIKLKKQEAIRQEIIRWSNPILAAVKDLKGRLNNIVDEGYLALGKDCEKQVDSNWSISYDYFMDSTLYLFGQYFCWIQMLEEELNFELFESQAEKDDFFFAVREVSKALSVFPPSYFCSDKDFQVFRLQQRVIGELFIVLGVKDKRHVISYADFLEKLKDKDNPFNKHLTPLRNLLEDISPESDCRWQRLMTTKKALDRLESRCIEILR